MINSIHIIPKLNSEDDPVVQEIVRTVLEVAEDAGVDVLTTITKVSPYTLIIAIGGDGTMLEAMRKAAKFNAVALGINLGRVGFLSDLNVKDPKFQMIGDVLYDILTDHNATFTENRTVLTTSVDRNWIACNEVSVSPLYSDTMLMYHLKIDNVSAGIHRSNGLLVSTATGSTAYSLSAGGALMMPSLDAIQIVPVAPITMTSRPIIVGGSSSISLEVVSPGISVRCDGQPLKQTDQKFTKEDPFTITINRYVRSVRVLHLENWNYFNALSEKLGWIKE